MAKEQIPERVALKANTFCLGLQIRHPNLDPALFTAELGIEPKESFGAGQLVGTPPQMFVWERYNDWNAQLHKGSSDELKGALEKARQLLEIHGQFLLNITEEGGNVTLTLSQVASLVKERHIQEFVLGLDFEPAFLRAVARAGAAFSMTVWNPDEDVEYLPGD